MSEDVDLLPRNATRAVRFFGEPVINGAQRLLLDVTLTSTDKASLEVSTPVLQF